MRTVLMMMVVSACTTVQSKGTAAASADERGLACKAALESSAALVTRDEVTQCERGSQCLEVSPLVSGKCGVFANAKAFEANINAFEAHAQACDDVIQVVPDCPRLQPVCAAGRCAGEPVSELPEECADAQKQFEADARAANTCDADADCTLVDDLPTTTRFAEESAEARYALSRACGRASPHLYGVRVPPRAEAVCVEHQCMGERPTPTSKFTTVVHGEAAMTQPVFDTKCISKVVEAFYPPQRATAFNFSAKVRVDTQGRVNHFQFINPPGMSAESRAALAGRLGTCRATPATYRKKPISIMYVLNIKLLLGGGP